MSNKEQNQDFYHAQLYHLNNPGELSVACHKIQQLHIFRDRAHSIAVLVTISFVWLSDLGVGFIIGGQDFLLRRNLLIFL